MKGHAIEVRVYAEDPFNNFSPDIGVLKTYNLPDSIGVRVDNGFEEGMEIPIFYDSMLCKLITYGKDRQEAIDRMIRAINDFTITGVITTLPFGRYVMEHESFRSGNFDTHFVKNHFNSDALDLSNENEAQLAGFLAKYLVEKTTRSAISSADESHKSNWKKNRG
jgi:acetyl/propionyl-CoA carboxylase alpha subunit